MKYFIIIPIVLLFSTGSVKSQSIAQLVEQLSLDVQKLSELKSILQDMYNNYEVLDKGYTDIRNSAEGNFNLHSLFLDALLVVSPTVRNYPKVMSIINSEYSIISEYNAAYKRFRADGHFTPEELLYLSNLYGDIFKKSLQCIDELTMVMTDNQLRMSDNDRLQSIDRIYDDITGQYRFLRQFNNQLSVQAIQRLRQENDLELLRKIHGISN